MQMTKKILSVVLAVMMVVSMMAVMGVSASALDASDATFEITKADGTVSYSNSTSFLLWNTGTTVKLLKDYTYTGIPNCGSSMYKNIKITLDLGGKTLNLNTVTDRNYCASIVYNSTLTVKNGTIEMAPTNSKKSNGFYVEKGSTLNIESDVTVNAHNGVSAVSVFGEGATVNTAGTLTAEDSFCIAGNGSAGNGGYTINVTGGSVTATNAAAIYHPNTGTLNISGGTIEGTTGVYTKAGTTNITGGTIKGNGDKKDYDFYGNGAHSTGDALVVDNCGYPGQAPDVYVTGGTFQSENNQPVASYVGQDDPDYTGADQQQAVDFISGGTFESNAAGGVDATQLNALTTSAPTENSGVYTLTNNNVCRIGGTQYETLAAALTAVQDGETITLLKDITVANVAANINNGKTFTIDLGTRTVSGKNTFIVQNGSNVTFKNGTIEGSGRALQNVGTVTVESTVKIVNTAGDMAVLNIGTATINGTVEPVAGIRAIHNQGTCTIGSSAVVKSQDYAAIVNTSAAATMTINSGATVTYTKTSEIVYSAVENNVGTITNKGTIVSGGAGVSLSNGAALTQASGGSITGSASAVIAKGASTFNMTGGTINCNSENALNISEGSTATLSSGTINATDTASGVFIVGNGSTFNMTGGTIKSVDSFCISSNGSGNKGYEGYAVNISGGTITASNSTAIYQQQDGELNISGGKITGKTAVYIKSGDVTISGGTFKASKQPGEVYNYNGNGCDSTGDAIVVDNCAYPGGNANVSITGGTFSTTDPDMEPVACYVIQDDPDYATSTEPRAESFISGGSFSKPVPEELCADTFVPAPYDPATGMYTVVVDDNPLNPLMVAKADIADGNHFGLNCDYLMGSLLGVQKKDYVAEAGITSDSHQETGADLRFVAVLSTDIINAADIEDYGFVLGTVNNNRNTASVANNIGNLKAYGSNGEKTVSCLGTSNNVCGSVAYGDPSDTSTDYKYVTCAVNGLVEGGKKVVARFYVKKGGKVYYAKYAQENYANGYTGAVAGINASGLVY